MKSIVLLLLLCQLQASTQSRNQPIEVGNKIPTDLLSSYKRKLIILDFWNTTCLHCISSFPKMDSLQRKFNDKLQIILITKNDSAEVASLFKRIKIKRPDLPSLVSDSIFSNLFPYKAVPHHVWIDSSGCVLYITDGYNADEKNISQVLNGLKIAASAKKDVLDFDFKASLLKEGDSRLLTNLLCHSSFFSYIPGIKSSAQIMIDTINGSSGLKFTNYPLQLLYSAAFEESLSPNEFNNYNRVVLEITDKSRFVWPSVSSDITNWRLKNVFSYESRMPLTKKSEIFTKMQDDLNLYLPYKAEVLPRKTKCMVLLKLSSNDKIKSRETKTLFKSNRDGVYIRNLPIKSSLLLSLKAYNYESNTPIVDSTNYYGNIDMDIVCPLNNIPEVRKQLRKYNLDLVEKEILIPMLVIKDRHALNKL